MHEKKNLTSTNTKYVLLTAAHNEAQLIKKTLNSVVRQTVLPEAWIIASDGSTDGTDEIVAQYREDHPFIKLIRKERNPSQRGFESKVAALVLAYSSIRSEPFDFIGHLDADISLDPTYFQSMLERFHSNPKLGLAGGFIYEKKGQDFKCRTTNREHSVAGAIQFFRRKCYEDVGKLLPMEYGGEDWYAEIRSRMFGWEVKAFPELAAFHHKKGSQVRGKWHEMIRAGRMDYAIGSHPLFEIVKCFQRIFNRPVLIQSLLRLYGYIAEYFQSGRPAVPGSTQSFLRAEQLARVKAIFHV